MTAEPPVPMPDGTWAHPTARGRWRVTPDRAGLDPCPIMIGQTLDDCRRNAERRANARRARADGSDKPTR